MLNRTLGQKIGLEKYPLQGAKGLVPLHGRPLSRYTRCLLFCRMTSYSSKELQAKYILDAGNIVCSED